MKIRSPESAAGFWSCLYFQWVQPTLKRGMREPLDVATLLPLNASEDPETCDRAFAERLAANQGRPRPVMRSMWQLHRRTFVGVFLISLLHLAASVASPLALRQLLASVGAGGGREGLIPAALLFVTALTTSMTAHHIFHRLLKLMVRVRIGLVTAVYRKALALTVASRQKSPSGQIINLMGTDAQKFVNSLNVIHSLWMHPLQLLLVMGALYWILGPAALTGTFILLAFLFLSAKVSRRHVAARKELVRHSDTRVGLMNEVLMSIRIIKFYAWERSFEAEVQGVRTKEVEQLTKLAHLSSLGTLIFLSTPVVVAVATFGTYVLAGKALNAADVFSAMALFNVLRQAMVMLPDVVTTCIEANVSVGRIEAFLGQDELQPRAASALPPGTVRATEATCEWVAGKPALHRLELAVEPGELICIVGPVGSGKSALMAALLGDLTCSAGRIDVSGSVAYVSQQAWILNDTVRNNILFGKSYDPERYQRALAVSCLQVDLGTFPEGDRTEIGERGTNLSGGQRQRISLARAVYHDADIVLLDDPLSALDNQVGQAVFERCIRGALRGRTRILATHRLEYVDGADRLLVMEGGRIVEAGKPAELKRSSCRFAALWRAYERGGAIAGEDRAEGETPAESPETATAAGGAEKPAAILAGAGQVRLMTDEERNTGVVGLSVYLMYVKAFAPGLLAATLLLVFLLKEGLNAGTDSWLAYWSAAKVFTLATFLAGFLALGLLACMSTFARSLLIALRGLIAGTTFHTRILESVLRAPMGFFESTPVGRILNRFSRDMEAIDQQIPRSLHEALGCVFTILTTLTVVIVVTPLALVAVVPIALLYYQVQRYFRPTAREGQRLDSITRSPIFAQFSESLAGVQVIRAFALVPRFEKELLGHLETNSRTFYTIVSANRWLGTRIETLGAAIVGAAAFAAVLAGHGASVGFVGLSVTYSLAITGAMNWSVRMFSQLESNLNSVERVDHYTHLPSERWAGDRAPPAWPARGKIVFDKLELRYRPGLPPVIQDLTCEIKAGEKIGVVGRTGAGKSSLLLALYRVVEPSAGRILVDGIDTGTLELEDLRSALAIIPQEPVLFHGSVRKNLDPFGRYTTAQLWDALERATLKDEIARMPGRLDADIFDGGSNFSVGQRQLLCLARALLKRSRILLMDEATASVDVTTDALIQRTIRSEFAHATVITIAHRLGTVMDCDRIMVLDAGRIVEFDAPFKLARNRRGTFSALLHEEREPVMLGV